MIPQDTKLSSEMVWQAALVFAIVDMSIVLFLVWRIKPSRFRQLAWAIVLATAIFWGALWTSVLRLFWEPFYEYVFPDWASSLAPSFGLVYACVGLLMWWLALRLSGNPIVNFCLLGGAEGLISHLWAIYSIGIIEKVPMLEGVSPASVLVFAIFEKILYWSIILGIAALLYCIWQRYVNQANLGELCESNSS
jgi:hypothetical protein